MVETLFNRWYRYIVFVALKRVRDPDVARDIAVTILERILRSGSDTSRMRGGYFAVAASRASVDHLRRESRRITTVELERDVPCEDDEEEPDFSVMDRVLKRLSDKDRTVLVMHYLAGSDHKRIARSMGLRSNIDVSQRLFRAKERARIIAQHGGL